ncbi:reverse transcriptase domain-containing protein [Tanacetum coccineum]
MGESCLGYGKIMVDYQGGHGQHVLESFLEIKLETEAEVKENEELKEIVTQVTTNVNNATGGNGNSRNNGCSYKTFTACNPKEFDGKGSAVALTRWIEKMESVFDNCGCTANQRVRYAASCFVNKALTWWNTQVQARGCEAAIGMSWNDFKAFLMEEFCPRNEIEKLENEFLNHTMVGANHVAYTDRFHELAKLVPHLVTPESSRIKSAILTAGILTDKVVRCGTLTKGNDKRKEMEESSKQGSTRKDNKKTKTGSGFVATVPPRNENGKLPPVIRLGWGAESEVIPRDTKLELGNSLFTIDLIPLGHGRMDWLSKNKAVIVYHEKVVEIPIKEGGILRVYGECIWKVAKALMNAKVDEPRKSDIPVVRGFTDVFPKDLPGLPPQRQVEFRIDLVSGAKPVAKSLYRLAPSEMQELSE